MDVNAIGFNYNLLDASNSLERNSRGIRKAKGESEAEQRRPKDNSTSVANNGKGRIVDVSL